MNEDEEIWDAYSTKPIGRFDPFMLLNGYVTGDEFGLLLEQEKRILN